MKVLNSLAATLVIIGALNWGLVALAEFDLVAGCRQAPRLCHQRVELQPPAAAAPSSRGLPQAVDPRRQVAPRVGATGPCSRALET